MLSLRSAVRSQQGFNLVEVLVALAVLSIGLLGVAGMQVSGVRATQSAYLRSQATAALNDMVERMYANMPAVEAGQFGAVDSNQLDCRRALPPCGPTGGQCTSQQMAQYDIQLVACGTPGADGPAGPRDGVRRMLPGGVITVDCVDAGGNVVACTPASTHRVMVQWQERGLSEGEAGGELEVQRITAMVQP